MFTAFKSATPNFVETSEKEKQRGQDNEIPVGQVQTQLPQGASVGEFSRAGEASGGAEPSQGEAGEAGTSQEGGLEGSRSQELQRYRQQVVQSARHDADGQPKEAAEKEVIPTPPYPAPKGYYWHNDGIWYLAKITKAEF